MFSVPSVKKTVFGPPRTQTSQTCLKLFFEFEGATNLTKTVLKLFNTENEHSLLNSTVPACEILYPHDILNWNKIKKTVQINFITRKNIFYEQPLYT